MQLGQRRHQALGEAAGWRLARRTLVPGAPLCCVPVVMLIAARSRKRLHARVTCTLCCSLPAAGLITPCAAVVFSLQPLAALQSASARPPLLAHPIVVLCLVATHPPAVTLLLPLSVTHAAATSNSFSVLAVILPSCSKRFTLPEQHVAREVHACCLDSGSGGTARGRSHHRASSSSD